MNENGLKKLSKSKLIKMLLKPININNTELILYRESVLSKLGMDESNFKKRTKSELIKLLLEKKNKPEMKLKDGTYEIGEHLPDSNVTIVYEGELIVCEGDSNADQNTI